MDLNNDGPDQNPDPPSSEVAPSEPVHAHDATQGVFNTPAPEGVLHTTQNTLHYLLGSFSPGKRLIAFWVTAIIFLCFAYKVITALADMVVHSELGAAAAGLVSLLAIFAASAFVKRILQNLRTASEATGDEGKKKPKKS